MRFITLLALLWTSAAFGQLNNSDAQYYGPNLLVNPSFEQGKKGWDNTAGSFTITSTAANVAHLNSAASIELTGQTLEFSQVVAVKAGAVGLPGLVSASIKTTVTELYICSLANNITQGCSAVKSDGQYHNYVVDIPEIAATGNGFKIISFATKTGFLYVDDAELKIDKKQNQPTDSLLRNGDFENNIVEYACTDATGAIVASTIPMQNSARMFQMTVTSAGGYCDFTATTGAKFEGLLFKIGGLFQTELTDVEYCTLVNGAEDNCISVAAIADDTTDPFVQPLRTQSQAGATSVGIRVKTTASTSGVVNFDKLKAVIGELDTGSAISCNGDLDCENVFSAKVSSTDVVSDQTGGEWINGDCTNATAGEGTCNFNSGIFTNPPNCTATATSTGSPLSVKIIETTSSLVRYIVLDNSASGVNSAVNLFCTKAAPDFKTITQQGVVNTGQASGALLVVTNESVTSSIAVGASTVTVGFADVKYAEGISFASNEITFLKSGKYELHAQVGAFNSSTAGSQLIFPELDNGSGYTALAGDNSKCAVYVDNTANRFPIASCPFIFRANAGDKVRLRFTGNATGVNILNSSGSYPRMVVRSVVDQQTIAASMIDRKIYDGSEQLAGEIAVVGGVEKTVYRRCYEIATDITTSTTIATIDTGLIPVEILNYTGTTWDIRRSIFSTDYAVITYDSSNGQISGDVNTNKIGAGTRFCLKYTY